MCVRGCVGGCTSSRGGGGRAINYGPITAVNVVFIVAYEKDVVKQRCRWLRVAITMDGNLVKAALNRKALLEDHSNDIS